jgi:hypothetical protein
MSVEDIRKRYNEIRASYETMANGYRAGRDNRDEFNDTINWTHVDSDQLFYNGTDDAGNPIMGSPVNLAAQYHKPETTEDKSVWDNVRGFFGNMTDEISNAVSGHLQDVSEMDPDELSSVGSYMKDPSELLNLPMAGMKQAITLGSPTVFGAVDWLKNSAPDSFKASKLYADYFYTADEKREQRQKIEDYLGIDSAVVANNPELWEKAMKTIQRLEKLEKTPGMLNRDGNLDMNKVYRAMPYLKDIQEKRGTNAAAMALSSADGLKTISDVYSNAFTQFAGSIWTGAQRGMATLQRQMTYGKAMWNARRLTDEEQAKIRENDAKIEALPQYSYTGIGSAVGAMVGSALENAPMILSSQGAKAAIGTAAGAVTAAATKNPAMAAKAAQWVGDAAAVAVMGLEIGASQYEQNVSKLDKNGNYMYTPQAAATLSFLQGGAEGVLEQYTLKQMGRAMFGLKEATSLAKLYERDAALKLAESGLSPKEAGRELIETRLRAAIASGALMVKAEAQEEFLQQASDMILENAAQVLTKGENADISSVEKILQDSTGAAMEALPAIMGFGVIGLAGHPVAHTRPILNARQHITDLMTSKIYRDIHENQYRMNVVEGVADNLGNIADLQKKDPKSVQIALDSQNRAFGMENTVVDVNALAKTENGAEIVETIAKEAGVSDEELSACQQGTGMLEVKTSVLQQISAPLDEAKRRNLFLNMTKDRQTLTPAQVQAEVAIIDEAREAFKSATKDEQEKAVATFVEGNFAAGEERKLAEDVLLTDPNHPMAEIRSRKKNIQAQLDEILGPIKAGLRSGMKQGVDIVQTENGTARASNNAPWYRKWYADHGRAPSEQEMDIIARDIALGRSTPYADYEVNDGTEEAQEYFADIEKQLSALDAEMAALNKVGEKLSDIRPGDVLATATLSPEARGVYHHLLSEMGKGNKDVQKSARVAALLAARMTDRLVALHREAGDKDYTAMDALPELLANAGETAQEKEAAQLRQEEIRTQKEAVRKQYEGTAMWMKAPNGKDTNLTEEQWLLVRTPAFKAWFGDWEYIANAYPSVTAKERIDTKDIIIKLRHKVLKSEQENIEATFSHRGIGKLTSSGALSKSFRNGFSPEEHFTAVANVEDLFARSIKTNEREDLNQEIPAVEHFSSLLMLKNQPALVTFTVKVTSNAGRKIYSIELMELKKAEGKVQGEIRKSRQATSAFDVLNISKIADKVNTASKVVDENGEPLVVYHGSDADFDVFDKTKGRANMDIQGMFFSPWEIDAQGYGGHVRAFFLNIKNPANEGQGYKALNRYAGQNYAGIKARENLITNGYDGVNNSGEEFIAFEPTQIKSVDNNGNFDPEDANIYHQEAGRETAEERVNRISQEVFQTYLNDGIMKAVEETVAAEIGEYVNLDAMADPVEKDKARDSLPYIKALLVQFNSRTVQKNVDYKDRYAAKIEYARRCFDNDERIKAGVTRQMVGNEGQGDLHQNRNGAGPTEHKRGNGAAVQRLHGRISAGISNQVSGEKRGAREHFEKLYNEIAKKHSENQGAFSNALLEQAIRQEVKGNYDQAQAIIRLFEGADPSTFMHEMSHHYLSELAKLAQMFPESEAAKDYETIMQWASWQEGQVNAYAGTASAKEFQARDEAIRKAEKAGDTLEVKRLKDVWAQERFARAFEEYLHSGDAPTSVLKQIFRRFKRWLSDIYKTVTGAGVRATSEVEAVMARMVATDAEIEAEALLRKAKRIEKVAPDLLDTDTEALMARWEEEAKEEAKEKMLKRLLKELEKRDVEQHMTKFQETLEGEMQEEKCWQAELTANKVGDAEAVLSLGYNTVEEYEADIKEHGGSYNDVLKKELAIEKKRYKEEMPNRETLLETAQEALATGKYNLQLTALEEELLARREEAYQKLPLKAAKALDGVEKAIEKAIEDDPDALGKAVTILKYAVNWTDEQAEMIAALQEKIKALKEKSKEERTKARESFEEEVKSLKETLLRNTVWLRGIRDAAEGKAKVYRDYARERLEGMTAAEATDARHWMREAQKEASASVRAITGAVQKKDGETGAKTAQSAKTRQLVYEAMAKEAFSLKRELSRIENHFARRQKTLANDKNGRIDLNHKYFINHLLYVYGLRKDDAIRPSGENAMTFAAMMAELRDVYNESNKVEDQGSGNIGEADMDVPEWLMAAALSKDPIKNYKHLTMDELRDLKTMVDFLYTTGRNKNRMVTLDMDIDDVVKELAENYGSRIAPPKQGQGIGKYMSELLKPETILEILGGKDGAFIKYIYNPIFKANEQESLMKEAEAKALNEILDECYTKKERKRIPKEKLMDDKGNPVTLPDGTELTRENLIAMALNWGNSGNRSRLMAGTKMNEPEIQALFEAHMRENDWKFVQAIWDHLEQYGDSVNDVMEKSTGNPLKRVPPEAFQVKVGDKIVELRGGYYPIVYDPEKSSRASEYDTLKDGQAVGGATAFGAGMGSTKKRAERPMPDSPLKLTLDVINKHINQQIHISAMRLACRDVYKLLGHRQVRAMIESTVGIPAYRELRGWVENIWQAPRGEQSRISRVTSRLRRNTVAAIMGYRVSTSLLNFANLAPMVDELGAVNAMAAIAEFIKNPRAMWEFVRADSVFMRNRATNMDQDLAVQQEQSFGGSNEVAYNVRKYASWLLERTDMLTSVPTYYFRYHEVYNAALKEGKAEEVARNEAHAAAHAAVRKVVGSSDVIDQSFIQRSKSEIDKLFTPFYSFFNAMMNAVWTKYYEGKYAGQTVIVEENGEKKAVRAKEAFIKQYGGFVRSYLYRFVLMAAMETGIRMLMEKAARGGDDKKKREEWYRRFLRQWAANSVGSSLGGFPMINSVADFASGMITGDMYPSRRIGVISTAYERAVKPLSDIYSMAGKKGKTDFLTLGRDTTKAAASWYGIPDTATDFGWNTARFLHDDYRFNRMDDLREYLFKSAFDKTLKAKRR